MLTHRNLTIALAGLRLIETATGLKFAVQKFGHSDREGDWEIELSTETGSESATMYDLLQTLEEEDLHNATSK